jgi:hypothetical protein
MIAKYKILIENSISAALAGIEIYNKPDFRYRNETFVILIINSWELLLKAKIIKDNKNKINSIYKYITEHRIKRNRNKTPMTIDLLEAANRTNLNDTVRHNLTALTDIRDSAIHFYNQDSLNYLIYTLSVATLKNYQKLVKEWFNCDLLDYNFYILPLGFAYNFQTFSIIDIKKEHPIVQNVLNQISYNQNSLDQNDYKFICEIQISLKSAKKITENSDFNITVSSKSEIVDDGLFSQTIFQKSNLIDRYPLSYQSLLQKIKHEIPNLKSNALNDKIRKFNIKGNQKYSAYNFRTKEQEDKYLKEGILAKNIPVIYNIDCLRLLTEELKGR